MSHPRVIRFGLFFIALASAVLSLHVWLLRAAFVPFSREEGVEYVFVSSTFADYLAILGVVSGTLAVVHYFVRRATAQAIDRPALFTTADVSYVAPLFASAASTVGLLNLNPDVAMVLAPISYLVIDLRVWWSVLLAFWFIVRIDARVHGALRRAVMPKNLSSSVAKRAPVVTLVLIALAWVIAGSTHVRFSGATIGDEPKYLRYCELWYQGLGFEIQDIKPLGALPPNFEPRIARNFAYLRDLLPGELRSLARDAMAFVRDPSRRFNQARGTGRFFEGKTGAVYQVHNPGLSFLMFPGYYVDRRMAVINPESDDQWPRGLVAVNTTFLGVYVIWVVVMFRFFERVTASTKAAWLTTLAVSLSMPVAAFPFQFYPELVAGLIIFLIAGHLLMPRRPTMMMTLGCGLLGGYLPWLHVRFSLVAMVLAATAITTLRREPRRLAAYLAGFIVPLCWLGLYAYRLTGSILPTAMWYEEGTRTVLSWSGAAWGTLGYLVDRDWGLFPHAPVYLLALPGYWWLWRRRPALTGLVVAIFFALWLPAAGHTLTAGGATPMRLVLAILPFAAIPMAELLARQGDRRLLQAAFGVLLVYSLHNALAYNMHHFKNVGRMVDWSFSGWKTNILFPIGSRAAWEVSAANAWLLAFWALAIVALLVLPAVLHRRSAEEVAVATGTPVKSSMTRAELAVLGFVGVAVLGTAISGLTGTWLKEAYRIPPGQAERRIDLQFQSLDHCAICASSLGRRITTPPRE